METEEQETTLSGKLITKKYTISFFCPFCGDLENCSESLYLSNLCNKKWDFVSKRDSWAFQRSNVEPSGEPLFSFNERSGEPRPMKGWAHTRDGLISFGKHFLSEAMSTVGPFPESWGPKFPGFLCEQVIVKAMIDVMRIAYLSNNVFLAVKAQKNEFLWVQYFATYVFCNQPFIGIRQEWDFRGRKVS